MSFTPLPGGLVSSLSRSTSQVVVELGSGDSKFSNLLKDYTEVIQVDLNLLVDSRFKQIKADARNIPFKIESIDILIIPNLWRHLPDRVSLLEYWAQFLANDGSLFLFEDDTKVTSRAEDNYQDLQRLLFKVGPLWRGELIPLNEAVDFISSSSTVWSAWSFGRQHNSFPVHSLERLLAQLSNLPDKPVDLISSIYEYGLSYGYFWWAQYNKELL
jgi:hypothetical protein